MAVASERSQEAYSRRGKVSLWVFMYGVGYVLFHIVPPFLSHEIRVGLTVGDVFDTLTPFAMILLIWRLFGMLGRDAAEDSSSGSLFGARIVVVLGAISFVEGHGMHLSANAIARHLAPTRNSPAFVLDYLFDEVLSHILWDSGFILISIGLLTAALSCRKADSTSSPILVSAGSLLYGFTYFCNGIEGQTVVFTLPLSLVVPAIVIFAIRHRRLKLSHPIILFYVLAYLWALLLFLYWGIRNRGFVEFSELGWI